jgi:hypothetical protein
LQTIETKTAVQPRLNTGQHGYEIDIIKALLHWARTATEAPGTASDHAGTASIWPGTVSDGKNLHKHGFCPFQGWGIQPPMLVPLLHHLVIRAVNGYKRQMFHGPAKKLIAAPPLRTRKLTAEFSTTDAHGRTRIHFGMDDFGVRK